MYRTNQTECPHYTDSELKHFKAMLIDCVWYKQSKGYDYDCKHCLEYAYQRSKQIEYYQTKTRNSI